jgi:ABC-type transport system substrate-binding protein
MIKSKKGENHMKKLLALLLALAMVLALAACGSDSSTTTSAGSSATTGDDAATSSTSSGDVTDASLTNEDGDPVYGGKATVYYGDELIQYFDPAMGDNRTYSIWLENLFAYDWGANEPENATSMYVNYTFYSGQIAKDEYDVDYDAETITVYIRDDVYFQDKVAAGFDEQYDIFGARQLKASDVAYSYQRLLGIDGVTATENTEMPWSSLLPNIDTITADDEAGSVTFHIPGLTEVTLDAFITCPVNITGPEWDELTTEQQNDWHYAIGTGPYILTGFQLDASMTYVASTNYYDYDERHPENKLPYLDEIEFVQIEDSANVLTQFISGQLDIISFGNDVLSSSEQQNLRDTLGEGGYTEVNYRTAGTGLQTHYSLEGTPMSDKNVRIAMQHAIDVETITKAVYGVDDVVLWGLWADPTGWDSGAMQAAIDAGEYTYDVELAKEMLAEAGYADGFEFTYYMKNDSDLSMVAQMVKNMLAQVNITMNIEVCSDTSELNQHTTNSEEDCVFGGGTAQFSLKFAQMQMFPGGPAYSLFLQDETWNQLAVDIANASSLEEQAEIAAEMDQILVDGHYVVYTCGSGMLHQFYSAKLGGVTGEQFCCNNNTRVMIARLWSKTGA